jgi:hypothetical protein
MRFIIMHKTNEQWEAGTIPSQELIARVGSLLGELQKEGRLLSGEGLRASSEGVRVTFANGNRTIVKGPLEGHNELPAGFTIVRAASLDEAVEWATQQSEIVGDGEVDIRPVTESWDIGMGTRPRDVATRRYMILRKATAATEAGEEPAPGTRAKLSRLIEDSTRAGLHLVTESMRPSKRGRRYKNSRDGVSIFDGPFIESKELLAGYVIVSADSLADTDRWVRKYIDVVDTREVDVRELV